MFNEMMLNKTHSGIRKYCDVCGRKTHLTRTMTNPRIIPEFIYICRHCHNFIHSTFSHRQLMKEYNSLEKIMKDEVIKKWIQWINRKDIGKIPLNGSVKRFYTELDKKKEGWLNDKIHIQA